MTGFGQGQEMIGDLCVTVEIRTVNNRFADLRFRLPAELSGWEARVRRKVLARVRRGRIELSVRVDRGADRNAAAVLNAELLETLLAAARHLQEARGIPGQLELSTILAVPGMLRPDPPSFAGDETELETLDRALASGLDQLDAERLREGAELAAGLITRLGTMQSLAGEMRSLAAPLPQALHERLTTRLETLGDARIDPARVAQEVALLADRCDVTEEFVRLDGHLAQARALLAQPDGEPVGKRLDFLLQEIHRETNTVNSKSIDLALTRTALSMKAEAEKVREQIQNLE